MLESSFGTKLKMGQILSAEYATEGCLKIRFLSVKEKIILKPKT